MTDPTQETMLENRCRELERELADLRAVNANNGNWLDELDDLVLRLERGAEVNAGRLETLLHTNARELVDGAKFVRTIRRLP